MNTIKIKGFDNLHLIDSSTGVWSFVGSVPKDLSFKYLNGEPISKEDFADICHVGPGILCKNRGIKNVSFNSKQAALNAVDKVTR